MPPNTATPEALRFGLQAGTLGDTCQATVGRQTAAQPDPFLFLRWEHLRMWLRPQRGSRPLQLGTQPCSGQTLPGRGPSQARPETCCSPGWLFLPAPSNLATRPFTEAPRWESEGPGSLSGTSDGRRSQSCRAGPGCSAMRDQPIGELGTRSGCTLHWTEGVLWAGDQYWRGQETGAQRPPQHPVRGWGRWSMGHSQEAETDPEREAGGAGDGATRRGWVEPRAHRALSTGHAAGDTAAPHFGGGGQQSRG